MYLTYKETKICYKKMGNGDNLVVFLHGWGGGSEIILPLAKNLTLKNNITALMIDFPPFGQSETPKDVWTMEDYANSTTEIISIFMEEYSFNSLSLIGHSFGGRVTIMLCSQNKLPIEKAILISSAGIKPRRSLNYKLKILKHKFYKKFAPEKAAKMGSKDYLALPDSMKNTFKNIVNTDLTPLLNNITQKTLIIFGNKDNETPLYMAKTLHKKIKNSNLIILNGAGHFVYIDKPEQTVQNISLFLNS